MFTYTILVPKCGSFLIITTLTSNTTYVVDIHCGDTLYYSLYSSIFEDALNPMFAYPISSICFVNETYSKQHVCK